MIRSQKKVAIIAKEMKKIQMIIKIIKKIIIKYIQLRYSMRL